MTDNLALWKAVERTDPARTKQFSGKGGFSGTAISPMWLIKRATEQWGPMGGKWGIRVVSQEVMHGAPMLAKDGQIIGEETLHVVLAEVFFPQADGSQGSIPCFGQTQLVGQRKDGRFFTDEEAPKKSLTDALTKGLSWLGFAADVHMGLFDDVKYINAVREEFDQKESQDAKHAIKEKALAILRPEAKKGWPALATCWKDVVSKAMRDACLGSPEWEALKAEAQEVTRVAQPAKELAHASA